MLNRCKAFCAQARQRIDHARAIRPIERRIPNLHQHAQLGIVTGTLQALQIDLRMVAQRQRDLAQLFVEQ